MSAALQMEFSQQEWDAFRISDVRSDHYIRVGEEWLRPDAAPGAEQSFTVDVLRSIAIQKFISLPEGVSHVKCVWS